MSFWLVPILLASWPAAGAESSCVACHRAVEGVAYLQHNFVDWEDSRHAKAGISCDACHGGDPSGKEKAAAHAGLLPSTNGRSPVYFTRIPATCGKCHEAEARAFRKSAHHKELQKSGRGPNCLTCHGSMANYILAPRELETTCTLCHRRPTQAYATLLALNNAGAALKRLEGAVREAVDRKVGAAAQERTYGEAARLHREALQAWHTFDMPSVLKSAQEISRRAATALNELRLKEQQKP